MTFEPATPPTAPSPAPQKREPAAPPKVSFWRRRVRDPLYALLTQGATPEGLARTLAWGGVCSMFPILGTTSLLNLVVGQTLKLNHALMQTLNQVLGGLHIVMIIIYVRVGEWIWAAKDNQFSVTEMLRAFHEMTFGDFFRTFAWAGIYSITAWALTSPLLYWSVYLISWPALLRLLRQSPSPLSPPAKTNAD